VRMRFPRIAFLVAWTVSLALPLVAQSTDGTINGRVVDPSNGVIVGADVLVINDVTGVEYSGKTNDDGIYVVPSLPPGPYRLQVSKVGFKTIIKPDIVLNVQDALSINFTLPVGAVFDTVTVEGGAPIVNTQSAAVSTVVDQQFTENLPLNGRSFQSLILLTPGAITNNPQSGISVGSQGEFSINGQRTESNYYMVDGVSANLGFNPVTIAPTGGTSASGSLPASTTLGSTQGLVSVDALEEFRVNSSSYSAEYGRSPGGQFSFVTRSGANEPHGTAFDYLRNNFFDANDWFNDYLGQPQPALRQNDFGGTLGGPVEIPYLYNGKDKTFFFVSYEGLRLTQPEAATTSYVPTVALRQLAPSALQPVINAFPVPNCPSAATNCTDDLGNGLGDFIGTWSNPSSINSVGVRFDHRIGERARLFFRFSQTTSDSAVRNGGQFNSPSVVNSSDFTTRTYTFGETNLFSGEVSNDFRLNFSSNNGSFSSALDDFGGAEAVNLFALQGFSNVTKPSPYVAVNLYFGSFFTGLMQSASTGEQKQFNLTDAVAWSFGRHQLKFGIDFRRLTPSVYQDSPVIDYEYASESSVEANAIDFGFAQSLAPAFPVYTNFSAFAQDEWKATPRLVLSLGLRWELDPAPGAAKGNLPYTVSGNNLATLSLAPSGTALWNTTWLNLAPRLGAAYLLRNAARMETVVRGGAGVFFDTGQQLGSYGYNGPGFSASNFSLTGPFPLPLSQIVPAIVNPPVVPYGTVYAFPSHLQLPYTLQWNASIQQGLGKSQALTVSYVGADGRRLLGLNQVSASSVNPDFTTIIFGRTGLTSNYNALQIQFQRRLTNGLQVLASYTWAHSIDYGSQNASLPYARGNSDFDIRHNFSSAFLYDLPSVFRSQVARVLLNHWGIDDRFTARTGFPVTLNGNSFTDPATGQQFFAGLNVVPDVPFYVYGSQYPGGRSINPAAFSVPPTGQIGDAARNFVRGFGAWQMDMAVRRDFPIYERLKLQFRAEAFNAFNHPNFGTINPIYCAAGPGCTFGQAQSTLANSLGGLSSLYQTGGARSMQFALKLVF
jgi:hypothetical protein